MLPAARRLQMDCVQHLRCAYSLDLFLNAMPSTHVQGKRTASNADALEESFLGFVYSQYALSELVHLCRSMQIFARPVERVKAMLETCRSPTTDILADLACMLIQHVVAWSGPLNWQTMKTTSASCYTRRRW
jgi:hypothetical protein